MRAKLLWKLELTYLLVLLAAVIAGHFYAAHILRQQAIRDTFRNLDSALLLAQAQPLASIPEGVEARTRAIAPTGMRLTLIALDGTVLADSAEDPAAMDNHLNRPEVQQALAAGRGSAIRFSDTVRREMVYSAVRERALDGTEFIFRLGVPLAEIDSALAQFRWRLWGASALVLLASAALAFLFSRATAHRVQQLRRFADHVAAGEFQHLAAEREGNELSALARALNTTAARLDESLGLLRRERDRVRTILQSMVEAVAVVGPDERLLFANPAFCRMLGQDPSLVEGRPFLECIRQPELLRLIRQACQSQKGMETELEFSPAASGAAPAFYSVIISPLPAEDGGAVLVMHDVTELRRLERVRRDFVANISHEFRTPLTAIQGFAETLLSGALDDRENARRFLQIIRDHAARLGRLTAELLRLSEIEARKLELDRRPLDVRNLLEACAETARFDAAQKRIALSVQSPPDLPPLLADSNLLHEALQNILDNAIRYTPDGGSVTLSASRSGDHLVLAVQDTGIGIPKAEQARIFERFYRVDPARSRELGGTGLGLSIARHLVELHHGRIEVESEVGRGSTFRILLSLRYPSS